MLFLFPFPLVALKLLPYTRLLSSASDEPDVTMR